MFIMEICISNLDKNVSKNTIFDVFTRKSIGLISSIRFVHKPNFKVAFVKFNKFYDNQLANDFKQRLNKNVNVYLVYKEGWFWICSIKH